MTSVNSNVIAKNTMMLYIRMLVVMTISLYTSRIILKELGISDYGIYHLVTGFISIFSVISNSVVSAIQRFFNVALGNKDEEEYNRIYSMSINLLLILSLFILIIGETIGLWFVKTQLNILEGREYALVIVYRLSLITLFVNLLRSPDNASIIAYEKMGFYAVLSILEVIFKLIIVFLLQIASADKLILYTILYLIVVVFVNLIFKGYCRAKFSPCHYKLVWNGSLCKKLVGFSGWVLLSEGSRVVMLQGENFFLNHYYSVAINASRGIATQVYNAINSFVYNFQIAFSPQLIKTYSAGEDEEHYKLIYRSAKFSFLLLLAIVVPVSFNMDILLHTWLGTVPPYTKEFCIFILMAYLADSLSHPLSVSISANGNIRSVNILYSIVFVASTIISFYALRKHLVPYVVSIITMVAHFLMLIIALFCSHNLCKVRIKEYIKLVVLPVSIVAVVSLIVPYIIKDFSTSFWTMMAVSMTDVVWVLGIASILGMNKEERHFLLNRFRWTNR